ncbi:MAG: SRPBCC domain-containing protein [Ignavibacteriales bacterium]|nr:SRPBCC domain-containing protein [Ignavibacteriales bacterium]
MDTRTGSGDDLKAKTKTIRQKIVFNAAPGDVYDALMSSKKHSQFTGGAATISRKIGGKFCVYDGYATGKNLELINGTKIVQTWRANDWEEGHYSIVEFLLSVTKGGCILTFTQKDVPHDHYTAIKQGWFDYYWKPMQEMFENG